MTYLNLNRILIMCLDMGAILEHVTGRMAHHPIIPSSHHPYGISMLLVVKLTERKMPADCCGCIKVVSLPGQTTCSHPIRMLRQTCWPMHVLYKISHVLSGSLPCDLLLFTCYQWFQGEAEPEPEPKRRLRKLARPAWFNQGIMKSGV